MSMESTDFYEVNGEFHWLAHQTINRYGTRDFADSLDLVKNPPRPEFMEQFGRGPITVEVRSGGRYAFWNFENTWDEPEGDEVEPKPPLTYFLPWSIPVDSPHGARGIYGLVQATAPGRRVIVIDVPGHGQAGPADWEWQGGLTYERLGQELAEANDEYTAQTGISLEEVHVSGLSNGGNIAAGYAAALGERAASLTLVSTPGSKKRFLPLFANGFVWVEGKRMERKLKSCESALYDAIKAIENTNANSQSGDLRTKAMLFLRFPWLMARAKLLDSLSKLHPETVVTIICGTDEAVLDWRSDLALLRKMKPGNLKHSIYLKAGAQHADLVMERYHTGAEIALSVKRLEGHRRAEGSIVGIIDNPPMMKARALKSYLVKNKKR